MTDEQSQHREYLERHLNQLGANNLKMVKNNDEYEIRVSIHDIDFLITTDLFSTFEIKINNYFKELTDYLNGSFTETIDWYIEIIKQIINHEYTLIRYKRKGKEICRYIQLKDGQVIGDYQNHFKLFAKRESIHGGHL